MGNPQHPVQVFCFCTVANNEGNKATLEARREAFGRRKMHVARLPAKGL
jgi:hypothetical protein